MQDVLDEDGEDHGHEDGILRGGRARQAVRTRPKSHFVCSWGQTWRFVRPQGEAMSYLKAKDKLDGGSSCEDAVVRVVNEEKIQDSQEEHQGCGGGKESG